MGETRWWLMGRWGPTETSHLIPTSAGLQTPAPPKTPKALPLQLPGSEGRPGGRAAPAFFPPCPLQSGSRRGRVWQSRDYPNLGEGPGAKSQPPGYPQPQQAEWRGARPAKCPGAGETGPGRVALPAPDLGGNTDAIWVWGQGLGQARGSFLKTKSFLCFYFFTLIAYFLKRNFVPLFIFGYLKH